MSADPQSRPGYFVSDPVLRVIDTGGLARRQGAAEVHIEGVGSPGERVCQFFSCLHFILKQEKKRA